MNLLLAAALAVIVEFTDPNTNEDGVNVYRQLPGAEFALLSTVPANVVTFSDLASEPGACYRVAAFNRAGESAMSNIFCALTVPTAPTVLKVSVSVSVTIGGPTP